MGATSSIQGLPDSLSREQCIAIVGEELFEPELFNRISNEEETPGTISKGSFAKICSRTDVFLTHDWGKELGQDNHARVSIINTALQERGLRTWFDGEQMSGNIKKKMASGIDSAQCVLVFITR
jgi:hypothetical protein